jgi:hypothetical protein
LKDALVAPDNPDTATVNVYPVPTLSIRHPEKVATPAAAATGFVVQVSVPAPGFVPMARVMMFVAVVTVFPPASRIVTTGWVAHAVPPVPPLGCTANPNCVAGPTVTLKAALVAPVNPVADAVKVYPVPILSIRQNANVATPAVGARGFEVQVRVPAPGFVPMDSVMLFDADVTVFPPASKISTAGWVVQAVPPAPPPG